MAIPNVGQLSRSHVIATLFVTTINSLFLLTNTPAVVASTFGILLIGLLVLIRVRLWVALIGYLPFMFSLPTSFSSSPEPYFVYGVLVAVIVEEWRNLSSGDRNEFHKLFLLLFLWIIGFALISLTVFVFTPDGEISLVINLFKVLLFGFAAVTAGLLLAQNYRNGFDEIVFSFVLSTGFFVVLYVLTFSFGFYLFDIIPTSDNGITSTRLEFPYGQATRFSHHLLVSFLLSVSLLSSNKFSRSGRIVLVVMILGLYLSGSRGAALAAFVLVVAVLLFTLSKKSSVAMNLRRNLVVSIIVGLVLPATHYLVSILPTRLSYYDFPYIGFSRSNYRVIPHPGSEPNGILTNKRLDWWTESVSDPGSLLVGNGFVRPDFDSHNSLLQVFERFGVLAGAFLLLPIIATLVLSIRSNSILGVLGFGSTVAVLVKVFFTAGFSLLPFYMFGGSLLMELFHRTQREPKSGGTGESAESK